LQSALLFGERREEEDAKSSQNKGCQCLRVLLAQFLLLKEFDHPHFDITRVPRRELEHRKTPKRFGKRNAFSYNRDNKLLLRQRVVQLRTYSWPDIARYNRQDTVRLINAAANLIDDLSAKPITVRHGDVHSVGGGERLKAPCGDLLTRVRATN